MKQILILISLLLAVLFAEAQQLPKLVHRGTATQLVVDGKPMLMLAGELSNSAATSKQDIDNWMPRMEAMGLNTVLVPAQWDLIEPEEGKFDFNIIDEVVQQAEDHHLKVVFLWFGAWKNSMRDRKSVV